MFGDELTRAGLPEPARRAARRRAVFVTAAPEPGSTPELRAFEAGLRGGSSGARPTRTPCSPGARRRGVLDALAAAGRRANLRRIVAERYLAAPPPDESASRAFRLRDGAREYL